MGQQGEATTRQVVTSRVDSRLKSLLDRLIHHCGEGAFSDELKEARESYFADTGEVRDDVPDYHARMEGFIEWYLLDRRLGPAQKGGDGAEVWQEGQTPLEAFLAQPPADLDAADRDALSGLAEHLHSLFQVAKKPAQALWVKDLLGDDKFEVEVVGGTRAFDKGDLIQGRVFSLEGRRYLSDSALFHPRGTSRFVSKKAKEVKKLLKNGDRAERRVFLDRLSRVQLRSQRYRRVEPQRIYDEFY
jgi:hypothetical protein